MNEFADKIETVNSKKDFINFIEILLSDLRNNPEQWENINLESYLGAMAAWTEDMDGYYQNKNEPIPQNVNWKVFANILMAAKMYE